MFRKMLLLSALVIILASLWTLSNAASYQTQPVDSLTHVRGCIFPAGGWTIINCSNAAAASSAALTAWSRYIMQCGDDSYFAMGTAGTGQDADSNDGWLPSGAWLELVTTSTLKYISVKNKNSDSDCRIIECQ